MSFILSFLVTAGSLAIAIWIVDGLEFTGSWWEFLIVAVILGLANLIVKPILRLLSLPIVLITFGLFLIVVNALVLQLVVWLGRPEHDGSGAHVHRVLLGDLPGGHRHLDRRLGAQPHLAGWRVGDLAEIPAVTVKDQTLAQ